MLLRSLFEAFEFSCRLKLFSVGLVVGGVEFVNLEPLVLVDHLLVLLEFLLDFLLLLLQFLQELRRNVVGFVLDRRIVNLIWVFILELHAVSLPDPHVLHSISESEHFGLFNVEFESKFLFHLLRLRLRLFLLLKVARVGQLFDLGDEFLGPLVGLGFRLRIFVVCRGFLNFFGNIAELLVKLLFNLLENEILFLLIFEVENGNLVLRIVRDVSMLLDRNARVLSSLAKVVESASLALEIVQLLVLFDAATRTDLVVSHERHICRAQVAAQVRVARGHLVRFFRGELSFFLELHLFLEKGLVKAAHHLVELVFVLICCQDFGIQDFWLVVLRKLRVDILL